MTNNTIEARSTQGCVIWITGVSGAGKSTLAQNLMPYLGENSVLLDGDELRFVLGEHQSGFERQSRLDLALKYSRMCEMLAKQGLRVVIATISMFDEIYQRNRLHLPNYVEIYVQADIDTLTSRDPKNIYKKYFAGELKNIAGLDLEVNHPHAADLVLTSNHSTCLNANTQQVIQLLQQKHLIPCERLRSDYKI